jgi:DNA primase
MKKGKISPELLQKIKDAVNLIEVVGEHVVLRKSGSNYTGLCPFHSERSPSFSVSEQKQLYHCYGCQKGGDLVSFVMEIHGVSFPEAIEELAERARIALPKDWGGSSGANPEEDARKAAAREKLTLAFKLNRFVAAFYHHILSQQPQAREYFRARGVPEEQIRAFYLGASPSGWDALTQHLIAKKAPLQVAQELGLIRPSPKQTPGGSGFFDLFRNRAMFPILDLRGKVVGFGGRSLPGTTTGSGSTAASDGPKYMNSPESPIFHKSKIAYGLYQAQKFVREKDEVILVEGYFDVIALHAAGFQNVVATCGTALTPEHLQVFKRFASKVTVLFDGDKAGIAATERAMELGLSHGSILYGAAMPEGLDPDEILFDQETGQATSDGKARMEAILAGAQPLLDARIRQSVQEAASGPEARTQALKQIGAWLASYTDPVGREIRIEDAVSQLGISRGLLEQAMVGGAKHGTPTASVGRATFGGGSSAPSNRAAPRPHTGPMSSGPHQSQKPGPSGRVTPQVASRSKRTADLRGPSAADRVLLQGLALGGRFIEAFVEAEGKLPQGMTIADLFDYVPARVFLARLLEQGALSAGFTQDLQSLVAMPDAETADVAGTEIDPQVRSIVMEAAVRGGSAGLPGDGNGEGGGLLADVKGAVHRGIRRLWARFSQQIKAAMQEAEAKKDAGLHARLSKEYLDVERKMKEFISFYDEA